MRDTFKVNMNELTYAGADLILEIKKKAGELEALINSVQSREASLAITNLEQSIMWATKSIAIQDQWITV